MTNTSIISGRITKDLIKPRPSLYEGKPPRQSVTVETRSGEKVIWFEIGLLSRLRRGDTVTITENGKGAQIALTEDLEEELQRRGVSPFENWQPESDPTPTGRTGSSRGGGGAWPWTQEQRQEAKDRAEHASKVLHFCLEQTIASMHSIALPSGQQFSPEDYRAMATTLFIEVMRRVN